jgi:hypothetical protein
VIGLGESLISSSPSDFAEARTTTGLVYYIAIVLVYPGRDLKRVMAYCLSSLCPTMKMASEARNSGRADEIDDGEHVRIMVSKSSRDGGATTSSLIKVLSSLLCSTL